MRSRTRSMLSDTKNTSSHTLPACYRATSTAELQKYFDDHAIQSNLNGWLNELVKLKPAAPYAWLASRIRASEADTPIASTTPTVTAEIAAAELVVPLCKAWGYCNSFRSSNGVDTPPPATSAKSTGNAKATGCTKVVLNIEAAGPNGVLLVIRKG